MSTKSKLIVAVIAVAMLVVSGVITSKLLDLMYFFKWDNSMSKEEISTMVNEKKNKLDEIVDEISKLNYEEVEKREAYFINELKAKRKISNIFKAEDREDKMEYIEFYCGGKGDWYYCGFYYSPNGLPLIVSGGSAADLKPSGDGWYSDANDVENYTERIVENYFYYEKIYK